MSMQEKPVISLLPDGGKYWTHDFENFSVLVYVPAGKPEAEIINFGFKAPYLLVFGLPERSIGDAVDYAERRGLADIARQTSTSVVFVVPRCEGGWKNAPDTIFQEVVAESRIGQYYEDGYVVNYKFRTKEFTGCSIRGSVFRTSLFGTGDAADYIAYNCLKTLQGEYLWGPGEITPCVVTLEDLSVIPRPERADIPIISVGNSENVNEALRASCDYLLVRDKHDYRTDYEKFWSRYKRWCGVLLREEDFRDMNMVEETFITELTTSPDNRGDDAGSARHKVGCVVYRPDEEETEPLPLLLAFHGGGDSAFHIAWVSGWWRVAKRNRFLLVCLENHLNTTATEVIELIGHLKEQYNIDSRRIYASGFSMGGCKTWDLFQEYPETFAALAPMDATFDDGCNQYGDPAPSLNRTVPVPVFYAAGEQTPLPELPCQAQKCTDRAKYVFEVNRVRKPWNLSFEDQSGWEDKYWGVAGDRIEKIPDPSRGAVLTMHYYDSTDGICRTVFAGVDNQGHECREHTCEQAWQFMKHFSRPD